MPCHHVAVRVVEHLEPVAALKLFILNHGQTVMADDRRRGRVPAYVREATAEEQGAALRDLDEAEIIPGFAAGMADEAGAYVATNLERFANPFLDHRFADLIDNHEEKIRRRAVAFLNWSRGHGDVGSKARLRALAARLSRESSV